MRGIWVVAIMAAAFGPAARGGEILNVGDKAPALKVGKWVKGEAVGSFEPGRTYVVEFWATWCGPCRASIPHLTELAHKYKEKGVRFVGVDVWEEDIKEVAPFLKEMGDKMDYAVALDDVPADTNPGDGAMATTWLKAAREDGIPTAFVVRDGVIQWIGHPMGMDKVLEEVVAGTYQVGDKGAERLAEKRREVRAEEDEKSIEAAFERHDYPATLKAIAALADRDKEAADGFAAVKFAALCNSGAIDEGLKLGEALVKDAHDDADELNNLLWEVIDPDLASPVDPRVARLALRGMKRAVQLDADNPFLLDSLAAAHYRAGDPRAALATEEKAKKAIAAEDPADVKDLAESIDKALARYRKAVEAGAGRP